MEALNVAQFVPNVAEGQLPRLDELSTVNDDRDPQSLQINWPPRFTPDDADLFVHQEIAIGTLCVAVWRHLVMASKWPEWYPNAQNVRIMNDRHGQLQSDSTFVFDTSGRQIDATIYEFAPYRRLGWLGRGIGINVFHTWLLVPTSFGCQVVMEQVVKGPGAGWAGGRGVAAIPEGQELWLSRLRAISET